MDSQKYLESYGWVPGEALQKGGLKKPILVSHKFDLKGVGHGSTDNASWWETIFDGQLKSLDVNKKGEFNKDKDKLKELEKEEIKKRSPLYQMFVKGEILMGTVDKDGKKINLNKDNNKKRKIDDFDMKTDENGENTSQLVFFYSSEEDSDGEHSRKKIKAEKKKVKKEKKEKKQKGENINL